MTRDQPETDFDLPSSLYTNHWLPRACQAAGVMPEASGTLREKEDFFDFHSESGKSCHTGSCVRLYRVPCDTRRTVTGSLITKPYMR